MKKLLLLLLLCPALAWSQAGSKSFTVEGKLEGYPDGTSIKLYKNGDNAEMASTSLVKEKFTLKGSVSEPVLCFLIVGQEKPAEVYIESGKLSFKGNKTAPQNFEITGSATHKDFLEFTKAFLPLAQQLNSVANTINATMPGKERDDLMKNYTSIQQSLQKEIDKFVAAKPKSVVTAFVLDATYQFNDDILMLESRFNKLDFSVRNSEVGRKLQESINVNKIGAIGTNAIDFSQPDTTGKMVSLSSFRGKYVLVDFWASWCGPCRQENPNVVENFNKFNSKNFTVLGVSLDRPGQKDKWLEAIHRDGLTWTHISDLQFWNNSVAVMYNIKGIPQNMLIDPNGKIIARNLRGPDLQAKLCEILGCN
jgi:peroxiredoxin